MGKNDADIPWHALAPADALARLGADAERGLSDAEAAGRLARFGPNRLRAERHEPLWRVFLEELREPMILLLLVTGVLYALWGSTADAITIFVVILALNTVEVFNERRAGRAIAALRELAAPAAVAIRAGRAAELPAEAIVPGEVVLFQAGRRVPADARLLEAYGLAADESALTGESAPVDKAAQAALDEATPLAERRTMVYAGTTIARGRGTGVVVATGMATELGRVASLAGEVRPPRTPLQIAMKQLSASLVWVAIGVSALVPLLGWLVAGQPLRQMLLTGLSLAFAMIPEELPIIITMVLALGGYRLARQRAIAKRLQAVETLGAVTVIATDKTGTLTENRMAVSRIEPAEQALRALSIGALCNDAAANGAGDPLELALLDAAEARGIDITALRRRDPLRAEFTFDNERKLMSAMYERDGGLWVAAKGAPEALLARSTTLGTPAGARPLTGDDRRAILASVEAMAADGLRVIALAERTIGRTKNGEPRTKSDDRVLDSWLSVVQPGEVETDLTLVALAGMSDPPRPEARAAIAGCRTAGIRTIMVTGDHPLTARAIAGAVGLLDVDSSDELLTGADLDRFSEDELRAAVGHVAVFARTAPEHKLRIVRALQARGERVAATGDGVNDAPALAAADIGVAMGETGTDVARAAADMVLVDDNFATIVHAVAEGRVLFANLTKGVRYYLACKVALAGATLLPVLLAVPVPFAPIQIILMELFMDLAAAATFVAEPAEAGLMRRPPRDPRARFLDGAMLRGIFAAAAGLFAAVTAAYLLAWYGGADLARAQTVAFITWLLGHVFLAINLRSQRQPLIQLGPLSNRLMIVWAAATALFVLLAGLSPWGHAMFQTAAPTAREWALALGAALLGTFWLEGWKLVTFRE